MKTTILFALLLCFMVPFATAQEGMVTYEETIKLDIELPPEIQAMGHEIPDTRVSKQVLYFNESASLYKAAEEDNSDQEQSFSNNEGLEIRIQRGGDDNKTYMNFDDGERIEKREFLGKNFLISGDTGSLSWKMTDERSEFLGYMCMKATAERDSTTYEAWFTPEISIPSGPGQGGLPGLILVMNINEGERSYVAKELSLEAVEEGLIEPPTKGKKVSRVEFNEIVEERMKEMNATRSGSGGIFIRMSH